MARTMNTELNEVIRQVLMADALKYVKEQIKVLERVGYKVVKAAGYGITVSNSNTGRTIWISAKNNGCRVLCKGYLVRDMITLEGYRCKWHNVVEALRTIDLSGILNTPRNTEYLEQIQEESYKSNRYTRMAEQFKGAKWSVDYEEREVARLQKQLVEVQEKLMKAVADRERATQKLNAVRKDIKALAR